MTVHVQFLQSAATPRRSRSKPGQAQAANLDVYQGGPSRLTSGAGKVADEMRDLLDRRDVSIFLFQDDDFPLWGRAGHAWSGRLIDALEERELVGHAIWQISCRAEYVEADLFSRLRDAGLYLVYMGLESGSEEGLDVLNKKISVATNRHRLPAVDRGRRIGGGSVLSYVAVWRNTNPRSARCRRSASR